MRALSRLSLLACAALALSLIAGDVTPAAAQPTAAAEIPAPDGMLEGRLALEPASPLAVIVLIGDAGRSPPLEGVIEELLEHQSVQPRFETAERFEPNEWLDRSPTDARTFAFVAVPSQQRAQLYFRGPHGERFLLRELLLRNGLDEVGRELIARVVETSVVALLRSSEGLSRDEARAGLAKSGEPEPVVEAPAEPAVPEAPAPVHERRVRALLGVRALGHWTGPDLGALAALGLEAGVAFETPGWPRLRARLSLEAALPQTLEGSGARARVVTLPMRVGMDVGTTFDLYVGVSTGFDVVYLDPQSAGESLRLLDDSTELVAVSRVELRYEPRFGETFWLAISALADLPWTVTHYDVIRSGSREHLATAWRIAPGVALSIGVTP
jgi:hypothetical protein